MGIEVQPGQWLIAGPEVEARANTTKALGHWRVLLGEGTTSIWIIDSGGRTIGCLIGKAINVAELRFIEASGQVGAPLEAINDTIFERWLAGLGGNFVAFVNTPELSRIYPSATCSFVWRDDARAIAATPLSLLPRHEFYNRLDRELITEMEIERQGWLPAGLTAHDGVHRLLPNHYLDLATWSMVRHSSGPVAAIWDPEVAVRRVGEIIAATMCAVDRQYHTQLALTAGRDSRVILACCRKIKERIGAFTIDHAEAGPDRDIPVEICQTLGIPHRIVGQRVSTEDERQRWLELSGYCVGGSNLKMHRTVGCFKADQSVVTGAAGEVGRGFYWNATDNSETILTAQRLLARMDLAAHPKAVAALEKWLGGLADQNAFRILDLAYIELRMGCWASPQSLGFPEACYHIAPLDNREIYDILLSLPTAWRREGCYVDKLIEQLWPDLCRWHFNRFGGFRQAAQLATKLMSWERIRRKVRRHFLEPMRA